MDDGETLSLRDKADIALKHRQAETAVALYSRVIELLVTPDAQVHTQRSLAYNMCGHYGKALRDAERAVSLAPRHESGYSRKGDALFSLGRYDVALGAYEIALVLSSFSLTDLETVVDRYQQCLAQTVAQFSTSLRGVDGASTFKDSRDWKQTDGGQAYFSRGSGKLLALALLNADPKVAFLACDVLISLRGEHPDAEVVLREASASGALSSLLHLILHPPRQHFAHAADEVVWRDHLVRASAELSSSSHDGDTLLHL
jgi:tetratricopeptide (TPR) repeat protein